MSDLIFPDDLQKSETMSEDDFEKQTVAWFLENVDRLKNLLTDEEVERFNDLYIPKFTIDADESNAHDDDDVIFDITVNEVQVNSSVFRRVKGKVVLVKKGPFTDVNFDGRNFAVMTNVYSRLSPEDSLFVKKMSWQLKARNFNPSAPVDTTAIVNTARSFYTGKLITATRKAMQEANPSINVRLSFNQETLIRTVILKAGITQAGDSVFMVHPSDPMRLLPVGPYFNVNYPLNKYPEFFPQKKTGKVAKMKVFRATFFSNVLTFEKYPWLAEFIRDLRSGTPLYRDDGEYNQGVLPLLELGSGDYVHVQKDVGVVPYEDLEFMIDVYRDYGFDLSLRRKKANLNELASRSKQEAWMLYHQVVGDNDAPDLPEGTTADVIMPASLPGIAWRRQAIDASGNRGVYYSVLLNQNGTEVDTVEEIIKYSAPVFRFGRSANLPPMIDEAWMFYIAYWSRTDPTLLIIPQSHNKPEINRAGYEMMIDAAATAFKQKDAKTIELVRFIYNQLAQYPEWRRSMIKRFIESPRVSFELGKRDEVFTKAMLSPSMDPLQGLFRSVAQEIFARAIRTQTTMTKNMYLFIFTNPNTVIPPNDRLFFRFPNYSDAVSPTTYYQFIMLVDGFELNVNTVSNWRGEWPMVDNMPFIGNLTSHDRIFYFTGNHSEIYLVDDPTPFLLEILRRRNRDLIIFLNEHSSYLLENISFRNALNEMPNGEPDGFKEFVVVLLDGNPMQIGTCLKDLSGDTKHRFIESMLKQKKMKSTTNVVETLVKNDAQKAMDLATLDFSQLEEKKLRNLATAAFFEAQENGETKFINPTLLELVRSTVKITDNRWGSIGTHYVLAVLPPPESVNQVLRRSKALAIFTTVSRVGDGKGRDKKVKKKKKVDKTAMFEKVRSGEWEFDPDTFDEITYIPVEEFNEGGKNMLQYAISEQMSMLVPILIAMGRIEFTAEEFLSWRFMEVFIYGITRAKDFSSITKKDIEDKRIKKAAKNILYEILDTRDFTLN